MNNTFFPPRPNLNPTIYAYADNRPEYKDLLKIGYTTKDIKKRVKEQYPIKLPSVPYNIVLEASAIRNDGTIFTDKEVHAVLRKNGFKNLNGEWFACCIDDVKNAVLSVKERKILELSRTQDFCMRPEQLEAVQKTADYFTDFYKEYPNKTPHFLWNAKMRFGKTFASYKLAQKMQWKKILILTFKPAVQSAWEDDLLSHKDFVNWQFMKANNAGQDYDKTQPVVCFGSFQDFLGKNEVGGIKAKNEWVHTLHWDCVILDEYHYGAWRDNAKDLFENEDKKEIRSLEGEGIDYFDEEIMPITTSAYLYLSGTPFRALTSGEFIEEQIYNWTYSDEQKAKTTWQGENNPYLPLPKMVLLTYKLPNYIEQIASEGEYNEFDLNTFFSAQGANNNAKFTYESEVQKWLDFIRGALLNADNLKLGKQKPILPFSDTRLLNILNHTFWFLPNIASCNAMSNLLKQRQNIFFHDYKIILAAGSSAGIGVKALEPVYNIMENPLKTKTITLSCGKLTTGVSVKAWAGIFMLRNVSSPETYFQASFKVQTPWTIKDYDTNNISKEQIIKQECYIFDFAPNRALRQIADYSCRLNVNENNPEKKVEEFIKFLPVIAYDGSNMKQIDASGVLDWALSGTTATLLARRWESALLVNVDNNTLQRLMDNQNAMDALMKIEGFRTLNNDIAIIINRSERIKDLKKKANETEPTSEDKKIITQAERELKSKRKEIQDKLIKFATRIPIFIYLTDYREVCLKDVISQIEPELFKRVTGIDIPDFELLVSIGLFNSDLMNDAVYKFKRYEDSSLNYTGINKHDGKYIGLYDTVINEHDARLMR